MKKVLIYEDEPVTYLWLCEHMRSCGYEVLDNDGVWTAKTAWMIAEADLIITDVEMPECDGFEVLKRIKASGSRIPTIAISAFGPTADVNYLEMARLLGADAAFEKPLDPQVLISTVRDLLDR